MQQLLCGVVAVFSIAALLGGAAATVMQELPPSSRIYLLGETKTFTCQGTGNPASLLINSHNPVGDNTVTENLKSNNITWIKTSQGTGINTVTTFTVTMVMTVNNNGSKLWCGFNYGGPLHITKTTVIAVAGLPDPPQEFRLKKTNMTALTLTWTAPWSHSITNYTVTMLNLTSNEMTQWTTTDTKFALSGGNGESCHRLQFSVVVNTDVGSSSSIAPTIEKGFLKELTIDETSLTVDSLMRTDETLKIVPTFEAPQKCSYETHTYTFVLRNRANGAIIGEINTSTPHVVFEDNIHRDSDYELTVTVQNEAGETVSVVSEFNTGFVITDAPTSPPTHDRVTAVTAVTAAAGGGGMSTAVMLAVTGGMGVVILLLAVLALVLLTLLVSRRAKRTRHTVCTTEEVPLDKTKQQPPPPVNNNTLTNNQKTGTLTKPPRKLSIPQVMATNPMYEASTPIYEYVPERKDLRLLGSNGDARPQPDQSTLPMDIPPQLPVRKATLDSPGVKSTAQLVLDKTAAPSEEYMYMKAVDPRYIKSPMSPLDRVKKEECMLSPSNQKE